MSLSGIPELVRLLQQGGKGVFLVSGGIRQVIHPIAESLNIPTQHVYANQVLFHEDGSYAGFDPEEFTSRSGGKAEAVRDIKVSMGEMLKHHMHVLLPLSMSGACLLFAVSITSIQTFLVLAWGGVCILEHTGVVAHGPGANLQPSHASGPKACLTKACATATPYVKRSLLCCRRDLVTRPSWQWVMVQQIWKQGSLVLLIYSLVMVGWWQGLMLPQQQTGMCMTYSRSLMLCNLSAISMGSHRQLRPK